MSPFYQIKKFQRNGGKRRNEEEWQVWRAMRASAHILLWVSVMIIGIHEFYGTKLPKLEWEKAKPIGIESMGKPQLLRRLMRFLYRGSPVMVDDFSELNLISQIGVGTIGVEERVWRMKEHDGCVKVIVYIIIYASKARMCCAFRFNHFTLFYANKLTIDIVYLSSVCATGVRLISDDCVQALVKSCLFTRQMLVWVEMKVSFDFEWHDSALVCYYTLCKKWQTGWEGC